MNKLKIAMFGEFSVSYKDNTVSEHSKRSKKLWLLLQYLVVHHNRAVAQSELIDILSREDEGVNPTSALKTQIHRLRDILSELGCEEPIIVCINGAYSINSEIELEIDAEEFEKAFKEASSSEDADEKLSLILNAVNLYTGDFLAKSAYESWVVPLNTYYRSVYSKAVHIAVELLGTMGKLHDIIAICSKASAINPYDEFVHYSHIKALAELGDQESAKRQYETVTHLMMTKFGITPSKELIELYDTAIKSKKSVKSDIDAVISDLLEQRQVSGAFFCEYQIFKHLYQLEIRDAQRTGVSINICLLTVNGSDGEMPAQNPLNKAMQRLQDCVSRSLRGSDIFSRYSVSQFVIMLSNTNEQTGDLIMKRIEKAFKRENTNKDIELSYTFKTTRRNEYD
ncbi:MAG: diguanylate cyclase [Ruminococcaceae bacterium]|nr:diguanylate cyclase [Oscillospiraceae bacterium]MBD5117295.1 diguanylate cyclase [Oscillospiraceae bacterium]